MKIIKRNGTEAVFDSGKIRSAVLRANACVEEADRISEDELRQIADQVTDYCRQLDRTPDVEEVQDQVERQLMARGHFELCKHYITYSCQNLEMALRVIDIQIPPQIRPFTMSP